jgi:hypothetical protein
VIKEDVKGDAQVFVNLQDGKDSDALIVILICAICALPNMQHWYVQVVAQIQCSNVWEVLGCVMLEMNLRVVWVDQGAMHQ